jgi:Rrf2 family protein
MLGLATYYHGGEPLHIRQIAALQDIPDRYLEQLLATLRRGGLIKSIRGAKGGYVLTREPWKITLLEVLGCIEGLEMAVSFQNTTDKSVESKLIQEIWQEARQAANLVWQKYTLQDLCDRRRQLEPMYYI